MKTVWIVIHGVCWEDCTSIEGVFDSKEKALEFIKKEYSNFTENNGIWEHDLERLLCEEHEVQ